MIERSWGRDAAPDERDKPLTDKMLTVGGKRRKAQPWKQYWRDGPWQGDQGSNGSCVGFAWAHWLYADPVRRLIDAEGVYAVSQNLDEWDGRDYDGTSIRAGAKVLQKLRFISGYAFATSAADVAKSVLRIGPVVMGTDWWSLMSVPETTSFDLRTVGVVEGGHAWLITGVDTKKKRFRMKNSWGKGWGVNGRANISFDAVDILLKSAGEACIGIV